MVLTPLVCDSLILDSFLVLPTPLTAEDLLCFIKGALIAHRRLANLRLRQLARPVGEQLRYHSDLRHAPFKRFNQTLFL